MLKMNEGKPGLQSEWSLSKQLPEDEKDRYLSASVFLIAIFLSDRNSSEVFQRATQPQSSESLQLQRSEMVLSFPCSFSFRHGNTVDRS